MTGIEKIIAKIEEDCKAACEDIISKAEAEAGIIINAAKAKADEIKTEILAEAESKCKTEVILAESKANHEYKKAILATKIGIINEVINQAISRLKDLPDNEYFKVITTLLERYAQSGNGVLRFSKRDLDRIPGDFEASINKMFEGSGKSFTISRQPIDIDGGFVIVYNDIEQNCSFESLLDATLDKIKDELFEELFVRDSL